jgi:hypothetical protein
MGANITSLVTATPAPADVGLNPDDITPTTRILQNQSLPGHGCRKKNPCQEPNQDHPAHSQTIK